MVLVGVRAAHVCEAHLSAVPGAIGSRRFGLVLSPGLDASMLSLDVASM